MKRKKFIALCTLAALLAAVLLLSGCGQKNAATAGNQQGTESKKLRLGYSGGACEAFLFAAFEKGFFQEEGVDVELVKTDFETLKEALTTGKLDGSTGMVMKLVKPFEQGVDAVFTSGIHTGCIQLLVKADSNIKSVADLKNKVIGNNGMGDGPMIFTSRALAQTGLDYKTDVQWRAYPATELEGVLERGEVEAITLSDPIAQMIVEKGKARKLLSTIDDLPYKNEYCCMSTISGKLLRENPAAAAAITRGMAKGAQWVSEHPEEAAQLIIEKKYIPGNPELVAKLLKSYNYIPSVDGGEQAVDNAVREMKAIGVLDPATNSEELKKKIFVRMDGAGK